MNWFLRSLHLSNKFAPLLIVALMLSVFEGLFAAETGDRCGHGLSASDQRRIISFLLRDSEKTPVMDEYWDQYSRFEYDLENPEKPSHVPGPRDRRVWFFPEGDTGKETREFLDISTLGLDRGFRGVTKFRVANLLKAPWLDFKELSQRQGALKEMMSEKPELLDLIRKTMGKEESKEWSRRTFSDDSHHHPRPTSAQVWFQTMIDHEAQDALRKGEQAHGLKYVTEYAIQRRQFFKDILETMELLKRFKVTSVRLRQIQWIFETVVNDPSGKGSGVWIRKFIESDDLLVHHDLIDFATARPLNPVGRRLNLLVEAFSELIMYSELSEYAIAKGWLTFPTIVDPSTSRGPLLTIKGGHAPRVLQDMKDGGGESIANSVQLGVNGKRHLIVTGPNGQGKSTVMRMVGQLLTLAQMGLPVPAQSMTFTPMGLIVYLHPEDNPAARDSLFMAEGRELWHGVYRRATQNPFQLVLMDEVASGTVQQPREDWEAVVLEEVDTTGVLSMTFTHNLETTNLGNAPNSPFANMHVSNYHLVDGANSDLRPIYEGAARSLEKVGVPARVVQKFKDRGRRHWETKD